MLCRPAKLDLSRLQHRYTNQVNRIAVLPAEQQYSHLHVGFSSYLTDIYNIYHNSTLFLVYIFYLLGVFSLFTVDLSPNYIYL